MKKIFSLPSINSRTKQSEFYSDANHVSNLLDHSNSSIDLTDEKRVKLEQLQNRLSTLYEELDKVLIKEEELTVLNYRNKKRKIEPISNFNNSIETLEEKLNESRDSKNSLASSLNLNDKLIDNDLRKLNRNEVNFNDSTKQEANDELDYNSNYKSTNNDVKEIALSKFYFPLTESLKNQQIINHQDINQQNLNQHKINGRKRVSKSKSFNPANRNKINLPTNENSFKNDHSGLLKKKANQLKQKLSKAIDENNKLKSNLEKTAQNEKEMIKNCKRMEEKILNQKDKIEQLQSRLTESASNFNKLKIEHEQFKIEMQIEREKFTNFVIEESKFEQRNNEKKLQRKLNEKDQLIANLINEIENLKLNLKYENLTIDLVEKNQLLSSQKISINQTIKNISIYQKDNIPQMLMINLDDLSAVNQTDLTKNNQSQDQLDQSYKSTNKLVKNDKNMKSISETNNQLSIEPNQIQLNSSIGKFCDQINLLQKEFSSIMDEEKRREFMLKIEDFVLKNMRKLVVDKMDSFFDTLQLYLAQLKFDVIQFAIENEQKRNQQKILNNNGIQKSSSIEWLKLVTNNLTNNRKQQSKSLFLDHNNNQQINIRNRNLRNNLQSRTVERRMIELRRSIETYLKSYLVRILLEMQDQTN